jgi:hypothetical protein
LVFSSHGILSTMSDWKLFTETIKNVADDSMKYTILMLQRT